ncbi:hypothetical protein JCM30566_06330 [Marinitoga arctica]
MGSTKNFIDILTEKLLFKKLKHYYYNLPNESSYDDSNLYLINFGTMSLKLLKIKHIFKFISHLHSFSKFSNKIGFIVLNNFSKKYIKYISEIAEIYSVPLLILYKNKLYLIKENTIKKIKNNNITYFKTSNFYFLTNSSELLYQLLDIRIENPYFIVINNISCKIEDYELNSISTALSTYIISFDNNNLSIYKPENNKVVKYKLKEHIVLKFNLKSLSKFKNGITKFDEKKAEILLKHL